MRQNRLFILGFMSILAFLSCTEPRFDNPFDPENNGGASDGTDYYIESQPNDTTVNVGEEIRLRVDIDTSKHPYQNVTWGKVGDIPYLDGNPTRNDLELVINNVDASAQGEYVCHIEFQDGIVIDSRKARVFVNNSDFKIEAIIEDSVKAVPPQETPIITVNVNGGSGNIGYQWEYSADNGIHWNAIGDGYNDNELHLDPVDISDNGSLFRCVVTSDNGSAISNTCRLIVSDAPLVITEDLRDTTVDVGNNINFYVSVQGEGPFTFVWYKNNIPVDTIPISNNQTESWSYYVGDISDSAIIRCEITDKNGFMVSSYPARVSVISPQNNITINSVTPQVRKYVGDTVTLNVSAENVNQYQWQEEIGGIWQDIAPEGTKSTLFVNLDSSTAPNYRCRLTNSNNIDTLTNVINVEVIPITITVPDTVAVGHYFVARVQTADQQTREWEISKDGAMWNLINSNTTVDTLSYQVLDTMEGKYYVRCKVSNATSSGVSNIDSIVVEPNIVASISNNNYTIQDTENINISLSSYSTNVQFQWFKEVDSIWKKVVINGNTPDIDFRPVLGKYGTYRFKCVVFNNYDTVTTAPVTVTVNVKLRNREVSPSKEYFISDQANIWVTLFHGFRAVNYVWYHSLDTIPPFNWHEVPDSSGQIPQDSQQDSIHLTVPVDSNTAGLYVCTYWDGVDIDTSEIIKVSIQ